MSLSIEDVKRIIMNQSVRMNIFQMVISGLPLSGKSELIKSLLPSKEESTEKPLGLELHEAIVQRSILDGTHQWRLASELQDNIFIASILLTRFFSQHSQLPKFKSSLQRVFDDDEIQSHMKDTFESLKKMASRVETEEEVRSMFRGTLSYVNIFDIGSSNAVHEFLMAIEGKGSNYLLINMLNINQYDRELMRKPLNYLSDERYKSRYTESVQKMYTALYHFMVGFEAATATRDSARLNAKMEDDPKPNAIIVGTHWDTDEIRIDSDTLEQRRKDLMELIKAHVHDMGLESSTSFLLDMMTLNMSSKSEIDQFKKIIIDLMEQNKKFFEVEIPLRFYFLRCILFNTKKLFISRVELSKYAKKLSMESKEEIKQFLDIFRGCGSIISSPLENEFLYNNFILLPIEFIRGLDKLYSVHADTSIPEEIRKPTQYGLVSEELVRSVFTWQEPLEGSLPPSEFYVNVLKNVGLMMDLNGKYFMPSLKQKYDDSKPKSDSLIITANRSVVSFRKQCSFLKEFISDPLLKDKIQFTECPIYNIATFNWIADGIETKISIQFNREYIQISVDFPFFKALSALKTACVAIMNRISSDKPGVRYKFCVVCPAEGEDFVPFNLLDKSIDNLKCPKCSKIFSANIGWIRCDYTGNERSLIHPNDLLITSNLLKLCDELSSLSIKDVSCLAKKMGVGDIMAEQFKQNKPIQELLFCAIYNWYCRNSLATRKKLAKVLYDCNCPTEAIAMDPDLFGLQPEEKKEFTSKHIYLIYESWPSSWGELGDVLNVDRKTIPEGLNEFETCSYLLREWLKRSDGDKMRKLTDVFEKEGYYGISNLILSGKATIKLS